MKTTMIAAAMLAAAAAMPALAAPAPAPIDRIASPGPDGKP
ncbi:MAG: endonuclease, partial [Rhizorhabdus sp.]|nr:endonuclease [Rhizorhabdus sp.]